MTQQQQAISATSHELRRRLWTLRMNAVVMPLLGLVMICKGTIASFSTIGCGYRQTLMSCFVSDVTGYFLVTALGLLLGILNGWAQAHFENRIEDFELEMKCAALELRNRLQSTVL
jgi:biopolymer transport protein ExbB/TolQ